MLYLKSVLFYMIILYAINFVLKDTIVKNGWIDGTYAKMSTHKRGFMVVLCTSAIPVFRFFVVLMYFLMAGMPKEDYEEKMRQIKEVEDDDTWTDA